MRPNPPDAFVQGIIRQFARAGQTVVDVGCGPAAYKSCFPGTYIGLDFTPDEYHPGMPRAVDIVGHAADIPLGDNSVDMVFSKSAFFLAEDHAAALREFWRVLRPGGRVLLMDYNRRTQKRLETSEAAPNRNNGHVYRQHARLPCWTQWQLCGLLRKAGFTDARIVTPAKAEVSLPERWARIVHQEMRGTWAIVTGTRA
jgi:SAM-dependent methyltransferase